MQSRTTNEVLQSVLRADIGLEKYQPDDSRETRMLGRFPRRNGFISDYVFDKTEDDVPQNSALSSPISPSGGGFFPSSSSSRHMIIYFNILPEGSSDMTRNKTTPSSWSDDGDGIHASDHLRRLESINPAISFTAPEPIVAHSRFTVYSEDIIFHAETVPHRYNAIQLTFERVGGSWRPSTYFVGGNGGSAGSYEQQFGGSVASKWRHLRLVGSTQAAIWRKAAAVRRPPKI
ncbi:hypothetical protein K438DRAFT_1770962 [Mycena galopus ATCC 62051]|nr:hypothetical protein K438DRAFT_1770962 [Mycena galopus ATCC 62051]